MASGGECVVDFLNHSLKREIGLCSIIMRCRIPESAKFDSENPQLHLIRGADSPKIQKK